MLWKGSTRSCATMSAGAPPSIAAMVKAADCASTASLCQSYRSPARLIQHRPGQSLMEPHMSVTASYVFQYGPPIILVVFGLWLFWRTKTYRAAGEIAEPVPDLNAADAFNVILTRSKWAQDNAREPEKLTADWYETGKSQSEIITGRLKFRLRREIHDYLSSGKLKSWGRPPKRPITKIKPEEWREIRLGFEQQDLDRGNVCAWFIDQRPRAGSTIAYVQVQFSKEQIFCLFPLEEEHHALHERK